MTTEVYVRVYEDGDALLDGTPSWAVEVSIETEGIREVFAIHGGIHPERIESEALYQARATWRMVNREHGSVYCYNASSDKLQRISPLVDPDQTTTF